jgi:hypothetical protein
MTSWGKVGECGEVGETTSFTCIIMTAKIREWSIETPSPRTYHVLDTPAIAAMNTNIVASSRHRSSKGGSRVHGEEHLMIEEGCTTSLKL